MKLKIILFNYKLMCCKKETEIYYILQNKYKILSDLDNLENLKNNILTVEDYRNGDTCIISYFYWDGTPQGFTYWNSINNIIEINIAKGYNKDETIYTIIKL